MNNLKEEESLTKITQLRNSPKLKNHKSTNKIRISCKDSQINLNKYNVQNGIDQNKGLSKSTSKDI